MLLVTKDEQNWQVVEEFLSLLFFFFFFILSVSERIPFFLEEKNILSQSGINLPDRYNSSGKVNSDQRERESRRERERRKRKKVRKKEKGKKKERGRKIASINLNHTQLPIPI